MHTIEEIEVLLFKAGNGEVIDSIPAVVQNCLSQDIDQDCLKKQFSLLHDMIKTANEGNIPVTKFTNIRTITEVTRLAQVVRPVRLWPYYCLRGKIKLGRKLIGMAFWIRRESHTTANSSQFRVHDLQGSYYHHPSKTFYLLRWEFPESEIVWRSFRPRRGTRIFPHSANNLATIN